MHTSTCVHMHLHTCDCAHAYTYMRSCITTHLALSMCPSTGVHACLYLCAYACTYMRLCLTTHLAFCMCLPTVNASVHVCAHKHACRAVSVGKAGLGGADARTGLSAKWAVRFLVFCSATLTMNMPAPLVCMRLPSLKHTGTDTGTAAHGQYACKPARPTHTYTDDIGAGTTETERQRERETHLGRRGLGHARTGLAVFGRRGHRQVHAHRVRLV
jgi:hypothetical protein